MIVDRSGTRAKFASVVLTLLFFAFAPQFVNAQGFLVELSQPRPLPRWRVRPPRPGMVEPIPYQIGSIAVDATIEGAVAKVDVSQTFKNVGSSTVETAFVFPLPYDGAVDSMTLLVDGKEYPAKLLDAKDARSQYESIVRKNRDPALLEWVGTGMFQTSVFPIPAGAERTVTISYTQLLRVHDGLTEFLFPLSCAKYTTKPVEKTSFNVTISGDAEVKNVYSPTYDLKIDRNGPKVVKATCALEGQTPANDFRLFFDQNADDLSAKLQSYRPDEQEDGYFLLLASPKIVDKQETPLPKTIVFTLDVSGSMAGQKIEQARESLKFVLSRLRDGDKFNIVLFGNETTAYKEELQTSSDVARRDAIAFVNSVRARGGTNIEDALKSSFAFFAKDESAAPKYFVFLSDGEPTVKETNEMALAKIAREQNVAHARFLSLGVGFDVNSRLLDRFVRDGRGLGEYVKPNENIEDRVAALYSHIEAPIFSDVQFDVALKDSDEKYVTNLVYPSDKIDVFAGEQIVVAGRYSKPGDVVVVAKGKVGTEDVEFKFDGNFVAHSESASYAFVERLWATRRVGEIVDQLDLNGSNQELLDELLELAKKHGILTPYTSFLADDSVKLNAASNGNRLAENFNAMSANTSNMSGFAQRSLKQSLRNQSNMSQTAMERSADAMDMAVVASDARAMSAVSSWGGGGMGALGSSAGMHPQNAPAKAMALSAPRQPDVVRRPEEKMRNVAGKTFYLKDGRWVDASIDENVEKNQKTVELKQFDDEYFKLIEQFGAEIAQYLVFDEALTLNFNDRIYKIEPAE